MEIRTYRNEDLIQMIVLWNEVVAEGNAFPQDEPLTEENAASFFSSQTVAAVAVERDEVQGLYILHPNNVGRCGHIANASYAVSSKLRGLHIGEALVKDSLEKAREHGFRIMQFNAVVASNIHARHLYESLGFHPLGIIKGGFRLENGSYVDIVPYFKEL